MSPLWLAVPAAVGRGHGHRRVGRDRRIGRDTGPRIRRPDLGGAGGPCHVLAGLCTRHARTQDDGEGCGCCRTRSSQHLVCTAPFACSNELRTPGGPSVVDRARLACRGAASRVVRAVASIGGIGAQPFGSRSRAPSRENARVRRARRARTAAALPALVPAAVAAAEEVVAGAGSGARTGATESVRGGRCGAAVCGAAECSATAATFTGRAGVATAERGRRRAWRCEPEWPTRRGPRSAPPRRWRTVCRCAAGLGERLRGDRAAGGGHGVLDGNRGVGDRRDGRCDGAALSGLADRGDGGHGSCGGRRAAACCTDRRRRRNGDRLPARGPLAMGGGSPTARTRALHAATRPASLLTRQGGQERLAHINIQVC